MITLATKEIEILFLSLLLLLSSSFLFGWIFEKIKLPRVIGEIVGGMIFGGSCLAFFFPDAMQTVFSGFVEQGKILNVFYQLGLIFLMFSSGYSTSISVDKKNYKTYGLLFFGATIFPMLIGLLFTPFFKEYFVGTANNNVSYVLVFIISMSITSIPVISKIFFDIDMMGSKYSNMVLTVSTIQDLCLWIVLNASINIAQTGGFQFWSFLKTVIITVGLIVIVKVVEIILSKKNFKIKNNIIFISLFITFLFVVGLSKLGVNVMYSSFLSGYLIRVLVGEENKDVINIKNFSFTFFVPVYFALVGIQLDVIHNFSFIRFLLFFLIAFGAEFIGTFITMLFSKLKKITCVGLGITMNARGGPGIVLATTAYAYNIISIEFFTVLILVTMVSSAIAGCWLRKYKNEIINEG